MRASIVCTAFARNLKKESEFTNGSYDRIYRNDDSLVSIVVWRMDGPLRWPAAVDLRCTARHDDARRPCLSR